MRPTVKTAAALAGESLREPDADASRCSRCVIMQTKFLEGGRRAPVAVVADGVVVVDAQRLQVLDQAALQVARARRLHRRVHQALAPRHAVEVVLLRSRGAVFVRLLLLRNTAEQQCSTNSLIG